MNFLSPGFRTLVYKESLRFWKVATQTVAAPILTAMLYLLIFGHVLEGRVQVYPGVSYTAFLIPGLVMMSVLQNAFANSSSSLIQSKITGNLVFVLLGAAILGTMGLIAGIWAEKFDQLAAFQNFLIMPLTFLSGVFYSIHSLPPFWLAVSHANPFFYMIDGFRHGFFGQSDVDPWISLAIVGSFLVVLSLVAIRLLRSGYRLRH